MSDCDWYEQGFESLEQAQDAWQCQAESAAEYWAAEHAPWAAEHGHAYDDESVRRAGLIMARIESGKFDDEALARAIALATDIAYGKESVVEQPTTKEDVRMSTAKHCLTCSCLKDDFKVGTLLLADDGNIWAKVGNPSDFPWSPVMSKVGQHGGYTLDYLQKPVQILVPTELPR